MYYIIKISGRFTDLIEGELDLDVKKLRENLRQTQVPNALPRHQLCMYTLPWDKNGVDPASNEVHQRYNIFKLTDFYRLKRSIVQSFAHKNLKKI